MLASEGYPWSVATKQRDFGPPQNFTNNDLSDALDSLNHVCEIFDLAQLCLQYHSVPDYCLARLEILMDFRFICLYERRDKNMMRQFQCLRDRRTLSLLYFIIGKTCVHGFDILNNLMERKKRAYFFRLNIFPTNSPGPIFILPPHAGRFHKNLCGPTCRRSVRYHESYASQGLHPLSSGSSRPGAGICWIAVRHL